MAEGKEEGDYAVRAAREWLESLRANREDVVDVAGDSLLYDIPGVAKELAAIIRKHADAEFGRVLQLSADAAEDEANRRIEEEG